MSEQELSQIEIESCLEFVRLKTDKELAEFIAWDERTIRQRGRQIAELQQELKTVSENYKQLNDFVEKGVK